MTLKYAGASILPLFCTRTVNPELPARGLLSKANRRKTGVQIGAHFVRIECVTHEPKLGGRYYRPPVWPDIVSRHGTTKYVVCVSVCVGEPCKTAEPIEMPFREGTDSGEHKEPLLDRVTLAPPGEQTQSINQSLNHIF